MTVSSKDNWPWNCYWASKIFILRSWPRQFINVNNNNSLVVISIYIYYFIHCSNVHFTLFMLSIFFLFLKTGMICAVVGKAAGARRELLVCSIHWDICYLLLLFNNYIFIIYCHNSFVNIPHIFIDIFRKVENYWARW